jgi:hypothetical protein
LLLFDLKIIIANVVEHIADSAEVTICMVVCAMIAGGYLGIDILLMITKVNVPSDRAMVEPGTGEKGFGDVARDTIVGTFSSHFSGFDLNDLQTRLFTELQKIIKKIRIFHDKIARVSKLVSYPHMTILKNHFRKHV